MVANVKDYDYSKRSDNMMEARQSLGRCVQEKQTEKSNRDRNMQTERHASISKQ